VLARYLVSQFQAGAQALVEVEVEREAEGVHGPDVIEAFRQTARRRPAGDIRRGVVRNAARYAAEQVHRGVYARRQVPGLRLDVGTLVLRERYPATEQERGEDYCF